MRKLWGKQLKSSLVAGVLAVILLCTPAAAGMAQVQGASIHLIVNGERISTEQPPIKRNGSIFVPLRSIFEALHATVSYKPESKEIIGNKGTLTIELKIGTNTAYKNQQPIPLSETPFLVNNSVYVPVRFISETLGAQVNWDGGTQTVQIQLDEAANDSADMKSNTESMASDAADMEDAPLPIMNDRGKEIVLQHDGNIEMNLKWHEQTRRDLSKVIVSPDQKLLFVMKDVVETYDENGRWKGFTSTDHFFNQNIVNATLGKEGYDIKTRDMEHGTSAWSGIPLYTGANVRGFNTLYANAIIDRSGNLIILTEDGLASYAPDGARRWVHNEWEKDEEKVSAYDEMKWLDTDGENRLYIGYADHLAIINDQGQLLELLDGSSNLTMLDDDTLLGTDTLYQYADGKLTPFLNPAVQSDASLQTVDENQALQKLNPAHGKVEWTYQLNKSEISGGSSLMPDSAVSDIYGHTFISTNNGTVHGLDAQGKEFFSLVVNNSSVSVSQIVPLKANTFIVVDNNTVMCFEMQDKKEETEEVEPPKMVSLGNTNILTDYQSQYYDFSFSYPKSWVLSPVIDEPGLELLVISTEEFKPFYDIGDEIPPQLFVYAQDSDSSDIIDNELASAEELNGKALNESVVTLGGQPAKRYETDLITDQWISDRLVFYLVKDAERSILIMERVYEPDTGHYKPVLDKIIESFQL
jgi:hypothetical protein